MKTGKLKALMVIFKHLFYAMFLGISFLKYKITKNKMSDYNASIQF
jgi:hypothetical protein